MAQDPEPDPTHLEAVEAIQDEISLYEGMLASLVHSISYGECGEDDRETRDSIRDTKANLKNLRQQLRSLESSQDQPSPEMDSLDIPEDITDEATAIPPTHSATNSTTHSFNRSQTLMPLPSHEPSFRKRQRTHFDYDHDEPESKSRRTSPNLSAAPSSSASTDSNDSSDTSDDPLMSILFKRGPNARQQKYLRQLEERKKQEEADAQLAQKLSQEFNDTDNATKIKNPSAPSAEYSQLFLRTNGSINQQLPTVKSEPGLPSGRRSSALFATPSRDPWSKTPIKNDPVSPSPSTPVIKNNPMSPSPSGPVIRVKPEFTPASGPAGLTTPATTGRIPARVNTYDPVKSEIKTEPGRYASTQNVPAMTMPGSAPAAMPGAFPDSKPYTSLGGNPVYRYPEYNSSTSALGSSTEVPGFPYPFDARPLPYTDLGHEYADPTKTKEELEELMKNIRPDEELTQEELVRPPQNLKATLMPHQLKGLTWMRKMEEGSNKGGILADDMGLGKTVQSIALMLDRPPAPGTFRPTLIVAPVALMHQWEREINKFVKRSSHMNIYVYHGASKRASWAAMKSYDVVLTTYGTLAAELKRQLAWEEKLKLVPDAQPSASQQCPILSDRSHFHRIILDEAQNIKNRSAKAALAACRIRADYRWALSGTPMQNNVEEMYSLVKFIRIRPYNDWQKFSKDIAGPLKRSRVEREAKKAMQILQALLRAILLRRTKQSKIDGKPILQLPPKTTSEERIAFGEDELTFYKSLEVNAQIQFNKFLSRGANGGIGRNYSNALVLLLRLRQACCHPRLVVDSSDFMVQVAGSLSPDDLLSNAAELQPQVVARLKGQDAFECPVCFDGTENPVVFPCGHTLCNDCLSKIIDQFTNNEEDGRPAMPTCPACRAKIDSKKVTDIASFLKVHDPTRAEEAGFDKAQNDDDEDDDSSSESESEEDDEDEDSDLDGFIVPDDCEADSDLAEEPKVKQSKKKKKSTVHKSKSKMFKPKGPPKTLAVLRKEGLKNKAAKRQYLRRLRKTFEPSAKTIKTVELLEEIKAKGQNEKTIIFSNFTSFLDLLEVPLYDHKDFRNYVRYDGSMSSSDRNAAVLEFTDNPHCNVILVSLKAGNAGLNLTVANHVVMLDPFWNPFVEYQAADRCYRIGQQRDVTVHRILIGGEGFEDKPLEQGFTVEDRILALQEKKRALVETALDESAGRNVARLGVRELGYLFGLNGI
ncbi:hypothetical protein LTR84_006640 [Exophiala bonariae]|uniref:Uncharacterized protein n=1 Tax=Exophiala bonariae TaxID=1690606 RepID=A0AAV9N3R8_9EURO|nr:hypothetical protein LTR84_006640 [Exophiala bonariae]